MKNHYIAILQALSKAEVKFVVAGGVAAVLHGVERVTMDIDIALDMESGNLEKFLAVMKELHLSPYVTVSPEILLDQSSRDRMVKEKNALVFTFIDSNNPLKHLDVFLTPELSYQSLIEYGEAVKFSGFEVKIVSRKKLLELKQGITPLRPKDKLDISELLRIISEEEG